MRAVMTYVLADRTTRLTGPKGPGQRMDSDRMSCGSMWKTRRKKPCAACDTNALLLNDLRPAAGAKVVKTKGLKLKVVQIKGLSTTLAWR